MVHNVYCVDLTDFVGWIGFGFGFLNFEILRFDGMGWDGWIYRA